VHGRYSSKFSDEPPGPYVTVRLSWTSEARELQGILDSGADQTTMPSVTAEAMNLRRISDAAVAGFDRQWRERPVYLVDVAFGDLTFEAVAVIGMPEPRVLIGRDILNELLVTLDGPNGRFTIVRP
jgi:predicted aspartyl protease